MADGDRASFTEPSTMVPQSQSQEEVRFNLFEAKGLGKVAFVPLPFMLWFLTFPPQMRDRGHGEGKAGGRMDGCQARQPSLSLLGHVFFTHIRVRVCIYTTHTHI